MAKDLQKSLQSYLSKIKKETGKLQLSSNSFSSSKNWVLAGCKHPKTLSFSIKRKHRRRSSKSKSKSNDEESDDDHEHEHDRESGHAATLSDIDRFLEENFKSLCIRDDDDDDDEDDGDADSQCDPKKKKKKKKKLEESEDDDDDSSDSDDDDDDSETFKRAWGPALYDSPKPWDASPELRKSSERINGAEEGRRSMGRSTTTASSMMSEELASSSNSVLPENCIAVLRYTPDPQEDFRRSMMEMVESRLGARESEVDWDYMEELLFCYLHLNDKKSHRFILSAFVDLIILLRHNDKSITRKGLIRSISTRIARERLRRTMHRPP